MTYRFIYMLYSMIKFSSVRKHMAQLKCLLQQFLLKNKNVLKIFYTVLYMIYRMNIHQKIGKKSATFKNAYNH